MKTWAKWLAVAGSFALACVSAGTVAARQASSTSSSSAPSTHPAARKTTRKSNRRRSRHAPVQKAPTADRISEIQSALARGGYYQGDMNGRLDANTVDALQKFQSANNLDSTGKLDAPTLQKLGLGSDIAGVAAPKPVTPNCCSAAPGSPASGDKPVPQTSIPSGSSSATASNTPSSPGSDSQPSAH
jgi:peptidoglycan hydrolase-like protein with peptidoglycan-binding domain